MMQSEPLRVLVLGAHPDDAEYSAGGLLATYRQLGHTVKIVAVTDGSAGHHAHPREELIEIRRREADAAAAVIGATSEVWNYVDGQLMATLEVRQRVVREIRTFQPDLVLTHRTNDYHPDHRAVGQAVQDASYMVRVPLVVPDAPVLKRDPVVALMPDLFAKPNRLAADVVVDVTALLDTIVSMLACHASQMFEWLPWLDGILDEVPEEPQQRLAWLRRWYGDRIRVRADRYRPELVAAHGPDRGRQIQFAEVYEISEYGSPLDAATRQRLFPFLP